MILKGVAGAEQAGKRLDDGAREMFPSLSRGEIRRIIDWGGCAVSGEMVRVASRMLRDGDEICLGVLEPERRVDLCYSAEDMLYEDREYLAVNKKAGFNSQRTPYQLKGTVEYAVSVYLKSIGSKEPARVVHRLDLGTSGVMIFPKTKRAATHISALLREGRVEKHYWALANGTPDEDEWPVEVSMARVGKFRYGVSTSGMNSRTLFRVIGRGEGATLIEARPLTGRTHQIRVHLSHCGLPVVGDTAYGGAPARRMMLHCRSMAFSAGNGRKVSVTAPVDDDYNLTCGEYGIILHL